MTRLLLCYCAFIVLVVVKAVASVPLKEKAQVKPNTNEFFSWESLPPTYEMKFIANEEGDGISCELLSFGLGQRYRGNEKDVITLRSALVRHETHEEDEELEFPLIYRLISYSKELIQKESKTICTKGIYETPHVLEGPTIKDEIIPFVISGSPDNRIDVVFLGDGYTEAEYNKFISDMGWMIKDMFQDVTFASYLPTFNIWAYFRPSVQSGIGVNGTPRNTAFGLYRDGTELRGIYCSKPAEARSACASVGPNACDFPSIIGNDPFYGGLGGEFTISTASPTSGTMVLRHEMGHNFGNVGEEYDGGNVYSGANSAATLAIVSQKWSSWLSASPPVAQQAVQRIQNYAWYNLANGPYSISFSSDGTWSKAYLIFSVSGCETNDALSVTIDGIPLQWNSTGVLDRTFYPYIFDAGFSSGTHTLRFQATPPVANQIRQLCNVNMHEYRAENLFHFDNDYVSAYPTWSASGAVTYRPQNERCLMRNMTSPVFCKICQENIWLQFFRRISLIDSVLIDYTNEPNVEVSLTAIPLAQFRDTPIEGERYEVTWSQGGSVNSTLSNLFEWSGPRSSVSGSWSVQVKFFTLEVRYDPTNLLTDSVSFTI